MKHTRRYGMLLALLVGLLPGLRAAEPGIPAIKFTDQRLSNGLRVIIAPDHSAPVFGISVTYNVGSRNEVPGRTGFAHLFEHMMFQGSQNVGKGEHFMLILNNGGGMNGTTNEDRTNYFETLPKNQLDLALFLESDRMRSLAVNQANLDNQRNAVQEERRLGIDNQPYGKSELEIANLAYDNFAYKHSTIGSMEDLNAASVGDVKNFFRIYYAPNNAVLTLVGDLNPDQALAAVKKYFGNIPSQPASPPVDMEEPEHYGQRSETIVDKLARLPLVIVAYHIPAGNTPDNYALQVFSTILSHGESSPMYLHLVKDKQLAAQVFTQAEARRGPSLFYLYGVARPGVKVEDLQKGLIDEVNAIRKNGVTAAELNKARAQMRADEIHQRANDLGVAIQIGEDAVYFNDPNLINTEYDKLAAVGADQVKQAADKYLTADESAVVITLPAPKKPAAGAAAQGGAR